jgi:hypothetical protein
MIIGKQSTFNDLSDLKKDLEQKVKNSGSGGGGLNSWEVAGKGQIFDGDLYDKRLTGLYTCDSEVGNQVAYSSAYICITEDFGGGYESTVGLNLGWDGSAEIKVSAYELRESYAILTSKNTITDSNGFIKAA